MRNMTTEDFSTELSLERIFKDYDQIPTQCPDYKPIGVDPKPRDVYTSIRSADLYDAVNKVFAKSSITTSLPMRPQHTGARRTSPQKRQSTSNIGHPCYVLNLQVSRSEDSCNSTRKLPLVTVRDVTTVMANTIFSTLTKAGLINMLGNSKKRRRERTTLVQTLNIFEEKEQRHLQLSCQDSSHVPNSKEHDDLVNTFRSSMSHDPHQALRPDQIIECSENGPRSLLNYRLADPGISTPMLINPCNYTELNWDSECHPGSCVYMQGSTCENNESDIVPCSKASEWVCKHIYSNVCSNYDKPTCEVSPLQFSSINATLQHTTAAALSNSLSPTHTLRHEKAALTRRSHGMPLPAVQLTSRFFNDAVQAKSLTSLQNSSASQQLFDEQHRSITGKVLTRRSVAMAQVLNQVDCKFIICTMPIFSDYRLSCDNLQETGFSLEQESFSASINARTALVLVDQHAADERVRVECILKDFVSSCLQGQPKTTSCCFPIELPLSPFEIEAMSQSGDLRCSLSFWGFGFTVYDTAQRGNPLVTKRIFITHVPEVVGERLSSDESSLAEVVIQFIHSFEGGIPWVIPGSLYTGAKSNNADLDINENHSEYNADSAWLSAVRHMPPRFLELIDSKACRGAIMFNDHLSMEQCERLLIQLAATAFPFQCAHGRPTLTPLCELGFSDTTFQLNAQTPIQAIMESQDSSHFQHRNSNRTVNWERVRRL